jgi:hypothetical protein
MFLPENICYQKVIGSTDALERVDFFIDEWRTGNTSRELGGKANHGPL